MAHDNIELSSTKEAIGRVTSATGSFCGGRGACWISNRASLGPIPNRSTFTPYQESRFTSSEGPSPLARYRYRQMKHPQFPGQLALPLDCSVSAPGDRPQSHVPSKRPRSLLLQARLEANLAMLGRLDTVPGSFEENRGVKEFRQGNRFKLTSLLSALITEVNVKRCSRVAALPSYGKGKGAKFSEGRPFVGRGSLPDLQAGSLGLHGGEPVCPRCGCVATYTYAIRKLFKCKGCNHQFSVTSGTIFASRQPQAAGPRLLAGNRHFRERRKRP